MIELIANGINILGNLASVGSFFSGFSVDRDKEAIKKALGGIEKRFAEFDQIFREISRPDYLDTYISSFANPKGEHIRSAEILGLLKTSQEQFNRSTRSLFNSHQKLIVSLSDLVLEIKNSYKWHTAPPQPSNGNLYRSLIANPHEIGVPEFWDISSVRSPEFFPAKIMSNIHTPIRWNNPYNGSNYMGNMNNNVMQNFGYGFKLPHYKYHQDGFIYDSKSGLYLPDVWFFK